MNPIVRILTLRCDEASLLASRELDEPLRTVDRLALLGHLLGCRPCRLFRRQLSLLSLPPSDPDPSPSLSLPPSARSRISRALTSAPPPPDTPPPDTP